MEPLSTLKINITMLNFPGTLTKMEIFRKWRGASVKLAPHFENLILRHVNPGTIFKNDQEL